MTTPPSPLRAGPPHAVLQETLGPLAELAGTWVGTGYNLIALPQTHNPFFRLKLNATKESFTFTPITAPVPDRGSQQGDISLSGLTYLQQVSDRETNAGLHIETGMWLHVPATSHPHNPATVVRMSTIPHGDSLLAQGVGGQLAGPPNIPEVSSLPKSAAKPPKPFVLGYLSDYHSDLAPPGMNILNPNAALVDAIRGQAISSTVTLAVSTGTTPEGFPPAVGEKVASGAVVNIPFVNTNAQAVSLDARFWIETVEQPGGGGPILQLQYTQTVILNFVDINWPHISVATLLKQ